MRKSLSEVFAEKFADYVIDALKRKGVKQADLARIAKVKPQTISKIVNKTPHSLTGKLYMPSRETVEKIGKAFGELSKAREAAGYSANGRAGTVEEALDAALYFDSKGISEADREKLRPLFQVVDREVERVAKPATPQDDDIRQTYEEFELEAGGPAVKEIPDDQPKGSLMSDHLRPSKRKTTKQEKRRPN